MEQNLFIHRDFNSLSVMMKLRMEDQNRLLRVFFGTRMASCVLHNMQLFALKEAAVTASEPAWKVQIFSAPCWVQSFSLMVASCFLYALYSRQNAFVVMSSSSLKQNVKHSLVPASRCNDLQLVFDINDVQEMLFYWLNNETGRLDWWHSSWQMLQWKTAH